MVKYHSDYFKLSISDLRLWIHLGCTDEEKLNPQMVSLNLNIYFNSIPKGVITDNIDDTICYADLVKEITHFSSNRRFNLIENFTHSVYEKIYSLLTPFHKNLKSIKIEGRKMCPPVPNLYGSASWEQEIHFNIKNKT